MKIGDLFLFIGTGVRRGGPAGKMKMPTKMKMGNFAKMKIFENEKVGISPKMKNFLKKFTRQGDCLFISKDFHFSEISHFHFQFPAGPLGGPRFR